ncbi:hypothetical protein VNO80_10473 [Phaseolus coccineus]|uniref:Uncharacterized protein n=1 Tax=Phaseolus coccineus TaxID=3886 RepID=A0AAN9RDV7_PHACN
MSGKLVGIDGVQEVKAPIKNSTAMSISGEVTRPLPSELHCYDTLAKSPSHTETSALHLNSKNPSMQ